MRRIFAFLSFFVFLNLSAQQNYEWLKINKYKVSTLSDSLRETSGLNFLNGKLYTFNDGGNTSEIFEIDKTNGKILNKIETGLKNFDWEAITSDENHFYIGEFGNNWGTRTDLKIYQIPTDSIQNISEIKFKYPEQLSFDKKPHAHNFDAESMIYKDGNLHVFTKEWSSYHTTHYRIVPSNTDEKQEAQKLETYNLGYLATDASYFKNHLYIIGYTKKMEVYLTVFMEDEDGLFFNIKPKKYYLGMSSKLGQIEGIAVNEEGIYISAEAFKFKFFNVPQSFYFIPKEIIQN